MAADSQGHRDDAPSPDGESMSEASAGEKGTRIVPWLQNVHPFVFAGALDTLLVACGVAALALPNFPWRVFVANIALGLAYWPASVASVWLAPVLEPGPLAAKTLLTLMIFLGLLAVLKGPVLVLCGAKRMTIGASMEWRRLGRATLVTTCSLTALGVLAAIASTIVFPAGDARSASIMVMGAVVLGAVPALVAFATWRIRRSSTHNGIGGTQL